jgi:hypothetical protein
MEEVLDRQDLLFQSSKHLVECLVVVVLVVVVVDTCRY